MHVGVIGGGLMGSAISYFLAKSGIQVTLLEQSNSLGGLNGAIELTDGLRVDRYQHAIHPTDTETQKLCEELGLSSELILREARIGFLHGGGIHAMTNIMDFLAFPPLNLLERLRLGSTIVKARSITDWHSLESISVHNWLVKNSGTGAFRQIWQPLLEAKFDGNFDRTPATYIWAWLNRMSSIRQGPQLKGSVGYLKRGHISLIEALVKETIEAGSTILTDTRVREIDISGDRLTRVRTQSGELHFDAVVAAIATPVFMQLIPGAHTHYLEQISQSRYLGLVCPVMVLDRPLSSYWTLNLTDAESPFSGIIETPHLQDPNRFVIYLPKYTSPDHDWMGVPDQDIKEAWLNHLETLFPKFDRAHILHFVVSRSRYVEPVHQINMPRIIAGVSTPYEGVFLANTSQVYPELPSSETVIRHARDVVQTVRQYRVAPDRVGA